MRSSSSFQLEKNLHFQINMRKRRNQTVDLLLTSEALTRAMQIDELMMTEIHKCKETTVLSNIVCLDFCHFLLVPSSIFASGPGQWKDTVLMRFL